MEHRGDQGGGQGSTARWAPGMTAAPALLWPRSEAVTGSQRAQAGAQRGSSFTGFCAFGPGERTTECPAVHVRAALGIRPSWARTPAHSRTHVTRLGAEPSLEMGLTRPHWPNCLGQVSRGSGPAWNQGTSAVRAPQSPACLWLPKFVRDLQVTKHPPPLRSLLIPARP